MKAIWVRAAVVVFVFALVLTTMAADTPATTSGSGKMQVPAAGLQFNGKQIDGGEYSMKWSGTGEQVNVTLLKGRREITTTTARLVALNRAPTDDAVVHSNGKLTEVRFRGKKVALVFSE